MSMSTEGERRRSIDWMGRKAACAAAKLRCVLPSRKDLALSSFSSENFQRRDINEGAIILMTVMTKRLHDFEFEIFAQRKPRIFARLLQRQSLSLSRQKLWAIHVQ